MKTEPAAPLHCHLRCLTVFAVMFITLLSAGCLRITYQHIDRPFAGLASAVTSTSESAATYRILVVHGMGFHSVSYSKNLVDNLVNRLRMTQVIGSERTEVIFRSGVTYGYLRTLDYANDS